MDNVGVALGPATSSSSSISSCSSSYPTSLSRQVALSLALLLFPDIYQPFVEVAEPEHFSTHGPGRLKMDVLGFDGGTQFNKAYPVKRSERGELDREEPWEIWRAAHRTSGEQHLRQEKPALKGNRERENEGNWSRDEEYG